jgi:predicted permease
MGTILQDVRYATRMLRKAPGASAVAIVSLAIGIGINTTVFGWIRNVLFDPLPGVADHHRIVTVETVAPSGTLIDSSYPDYQAWRDHATLLSGVIAFKERPVGVGVAGRGDDANAERAWAMLVSGNYFDVLGVRPALGRFFEGDEQRDTFDAHPVAVLAHAMWRRRFNADPAVVGRTIALNRRPYTVIGVAPDGFHGTITGLQFDLFVPLTMQASLTGGGQWLANGHARALYLFARLTPGATIEQARDEVRALAAARARERPDVNRDISATLLPLDEARRGSQHELGPLLKILMAVGALLLLIVCANVANLQLARAAARRREIGVRLGLGATRRRLVQQLLTEGIVLGAVAGVLGALLSAWLVDTLRYFLPFIEYPLMLPTTIDAREIVFAAAVSVAASVLFALVPALRASAAGVMAALNDRLTADAQANRIGSALVTAQVALAVVTLAGAALLVRSFENARRVDMGFEARGLLLAGLNLSTGGYDRDAALRYVDRAIARTQTLPGVRRVSVAEDVPLGFNGGSWEELAIDGYVPGPSENMRVYRNLVSPGYFESMGIRLASGRDISDRDTVDTARVAIVNETFVRRYLGGGDAIGRRITGWGRPIAIVGVVSDSKYHELGEAAQPYFYVPLKQFFSANTGLALHVRVAGAPSLAAALTPALLEVLRELDPRMAPPVTTTLEEYTSAAYFTQRLAATLLTILASLALALSAIGLYSVMAYAVARRRREIGVRMALGATRAAILQLVVGRGLSLVAGGVAAGLVLALAVTRALGSLLFGVSPLDATALTGAVALLIAVACLASYLPARAASRIEPMSALRTD